ncbi:MAG: SRPBCC family protein [Acidimicrobiia bacterium]
MQITHEFDVARPLAAVWEKLQDVPSVAQCLPGATLQESKGEDVYVGNISVKLGPIAATFEGEAKVSTDPTTHTAVIDGKGVDKKGGSRGQVKVNYGLAEKDSSSTHVTIDADITLAGPAAQFGRTGLINEMSRRLIADFVGCLEQKMAALSGEAAASIEAGEVKPFRLFWSSLLSWLRSFFGKKPS